MVSLVYTTQEPSQNSDSETEKPATGRLGPSPAITLTSSMATERYSPSAKVLNPFFQRKPIFTLGLLFALAGRSIVQSPHACSVTGSQKPWGKVLSSSRSTQVTPSK